MKLKTLLIMTTVVVLVYGIVLVLSPSTMLSLHGVPEEAGAKLLGQFFGTQLIAIGLVTWFARDVTDPAAQRAIILAMIISDAIGFVVAVVGTVNGPMNAVGWSAAGVYLVMGLGYVYFQFIKPSSA